MGVEEADSFVKVELAPIESKTLLEQEAVPRCNVYTPMCIGATVCFATIVSVIVIVGFVVLTVLGFTIHNGRYILMALAPFYVIIALLILYCGVFVFLPAFTRFLGQVTIEAYNEINV